MELNEIKKLLGSDTKCSNCDCPKSSIYRIHTVKKRSDNDYTIDSYRLLCNRCIKKYRKTHPDILTEEQYKSLCNWKGFEYNLPKPFIKVKMNVKSSGVDKLIKVCKLSLTKEEQASNRQKKYESKEWIATREAVFKRDGYECKKCGTSENLRCHHTMYVGKYPIWAYDLCVFETLCKDCHEDFHKTTRGTDLVVTEGQYRNHIRVFGQGSLSINNRHKFDKKEYIAPKIKAKNHRTKSEVAPIVYSTNKEKNIIYRESAKPKKPLNAYQKALEYKRQTS